MDKLGKLMWVSTMSMFFVLGLGWVSFIIVTFFNPYVTPVRKPVPKYFSLGRGYSPRQIKAHLARQGLLPEQIPGK
jgi:hypothetical protein